MTNPMFPCKLPVSLTRTVSRAIAAMLMTAVVASCGSSPSEPQAEESETSAAVEETTAQAEETDTIRCVFPFWFGFAPVHVATNLGYFEEEGLTVTTAFDNDRANVLPAMERGDLECTMRTIGEHMSRPLTATSKSTVIGTIDVSVGADGVVAGPDINSVEDLVGKVFAGEINHPGTVMTQFALNEAGYSIEDVEIRLINTDDSSAVFEDPDVAAVATWEPMMSNIVDTTAKTGSKILLSSANFKGLITDVIIVQSEDLAADPEKYQKFLRGIYRAVDLYNEDPDAFLEAAAPEYDVTPEEMAADLGGVQYTSYEDTLEFMGSAESPSTLATVFDSLNEINVQLDLQDDLLSYDDHIDGSLLTDLFEGATR
ncbi:MAG: ABC transporter substrate-binding protein [Cyanobacteria bacterium P01_F01_bin.86]